VRRRLEDRQLKETENGIIPTWDKWSSLAARGDSGAAVKVQYFGDVNDYRKFALLRLLADIGKFKIGVCWMLTEADDSKEGGNRKYLDQGAKWCGYDPALFDALARVQAPPQLSDLQRIEADGIVPGATFFNDDTPDKLAERQVFHAHCMATFADRDLVFFDPDNGLEVKSVPKGWKRSSKYVFECEIGDHYRAGRSALIYQHFPMHVTHDVCIANAASRLAARLPGVAIWSIVTAHVVFLLVVRPEHEARAAAVVETLSARGWLPHFVKSASRCELSTATKAEPLG
jgi:hypothetical protein